MNGELVASCKALLLDADYRATRAHAFNYLGDGYDAINCIILSEIKSADPFGRRHVGRNLSTSSIFDIRHFGTTPDSDWIKAGVLSDPVTLFSGVNMDPFQAEYGPPFPGQSFPCSIPCLSPP